MLRFFIQGSAREPYEITAEGSGESIRIFCRCPAGRKGGAFCKHITWLLSGDVTKLVGARSDSVIELRRRAEGSKYIALAANHSLPEMRGSRCDGFSTLSEFYDAFKQELENLGWTVRLMASQDSNDASVSLFKSFKNGRLRTTPSWRLTYEELTGDAVYSADAPDGFTIENLRPRERPYGVSGPKGSVGTRKRLQDAAELFLKSVAG